MAYTAQRVIEVAEEWLGFHEEGENGNPFDEVLAPFSDEIDFDAAWCDLFVDYCHYIAAGEDADKAQYGLCGEFDDYTVNSAEYYQDAGRYGDEPRLGAQIFFRNSQGICHTGIVTGYDDDYVWTIEGNSSDEVRAHCYELDYWKIDGYGYPRFDEETSMNANPQVPGDPVNDADLWYRVHIANCGWLGAVHDGQTAGTTGRALRVEALKISPPEGLVLEAKAHIENVGWVTYPGIKKGESSGEGSSINDPIIGTVGEKKRLEAIIINVTENTTGKELWYRVHNQDVGWTSWVKAGYATGSVGFSKRIEAIQMKLV